MPHIGKSCLLSLNGSNRSGGPRSPTRAGERTPHVRQPASLAPRGGASHTVRPAMPRVPRLPLVPDPLRRIHVPRDIKSITTVGHEEDPESLGVSLRTINRIWTAVRELYKTGVHPAVQLCLRRNGRVVLDRAIGHARGNGPHDARDTPKELATTETPFCVFSASKAVTAMV